MKKLKKKKKIMHKPKWRIGQIKEKYSPNNKNASCLKFYNFFKIVHLLDFVSFLTSGTKSVTYEAKANPFSSN